MTYETDLLACRPTLMRYACKLTRNVTDAEDLLQSTLLRALEKRHLFDGRSLIAWCTTMMYNLFAAEARTKLRWGWQSLESARYTVVMPLQESTLRAQEMALMVDRMNPLYRDALLRFEVDEQSQDEIAIATATTVGTVKSRISRGRKELREMDR